MNEEEIFHQALARSLPEERAAYLQQACAGNPALRASVEALLRANVGASSFMDRPIPASMATVDDTSSERPGTVIGPYKLLEQIGEGGFGVVFMAEQCQPMRRKVALKVLKPGMDTRQVVARFEAERQALALMDHSNIAHVLDGGETASGRPYFVMELVRGIPITDFCDQNQLSVRRRLELFLAVCQAVQHAHQKGIIHRDIKPSNVLVTLHDDTPVVKVIDFGIAKATGQQLTEKTLFTNFALMIGTPLYMSPEQAQMSGLDVDTRSDIYSLGVLLYELLTSTTPFDKERLRTSAFDEIRRIIREEEPAKPSTRISTLGQACAMVSAKRQSDPIRLSQLFRGELDWIAMKALEKNRTRRYDTASGLAADVQRFLNDEHVLACPPSAWYRCRKFARRNKVALMTASLVTLALVVGTVVSTWQTIRAIQAEVLAETRLAGETAARNDSDLALQAETRAKAELSRTLKSEQESLYFQRVARADLEWWNNNVGRADQILNECPADFRHWEWRYLKRLCHAELFTLEGHTEPVHSVTFSPDGRRLASASLDKNVKIWDLATGKEIRTIAGQNQIVTCVAWSGDSRLLASGSGIWDESRPGEVKVWDATTGRNLVNLAGSRAAIRAVAFSPDSQKIAAAGWDRTVRLWDVSTGQEVRVLRGHEFRCLAFSPDGLHLATGSRGRTIIIWNVASGAQQAILRGHTRDIYSVAFSPDGKRLVSGSWDQTVRVWDVATGKEVFAPARHTDIVWGVDFSPDGQSVASASNDGSVKIWNAETGQELATLRGHSGYVYSVAFSPGGRCLATASWDQTVKIWDLTSDQQRLSFKTPARFFRSALSPDSKSIAMASRTPDDPQRLLRLQIYDLLNGRASLFLGECPGGCHGAAFSPDGQRLASDWGNAVKIWNAQTGQEVVTLTGHLKPVSCVAFSPDSRRLASASADKTVKLWDASTGKELLVLAGHTETVNSVAFSPNGQFLASGSEDHTIKIWDANNGRELSTLAGHGGPVNEVAFSRLGERLASASEDRTVQIWDSRTWQAILTLQGTGAVTAVAFTPDGQRLASAGLDGSVRLWDSVTGLEALTFRREFSLVFGVAFTPDGERLIASGYKPTFEGFKVWRTKDSRPDPGVARDQALKADAQNACWLRGDAYSRLRFWDKAVVAYTEAIELGHEDAHIWIERGTAYAMLAQYKNATRDFALAVQAKPDDPYLWYCHAITELGAGDLDGYRRVCAGMGQQFGKPKDSLTAGWLILVHTVADAGTSKADLEQWGKSVIEAPSDWPRLQGHALYRAGQYGAAIDSFHRSAKAFPLRGGDLCCLAMAQQRLEKVEDAHSTLVIALDWITNSERILAGGGYWSWSEQIEVGCLRREAEALLQVK